MDVTPAHHHPLKWPLVVHDQPDQQAHADKSEQEGKRCDEHAPARAVGNRGADEVSQPGQLEQDQENHHDQAGKGQQ